MIPYAGISFLTHDTVSDVLRHAHLASYTVLQSQSQSPSEKHTKRNGPVQSNASAEVPLVPSPDWSLKQLHARLKSSAGECR
ncbi:hypothetical protein EDD37DRAFT_636641 [Exophiala viscosa]|uniref:uncharacterized protein n=1 Tax=Exophiala viscosa TaxID=2486360 RepID=UPI00219E5B97|nr:hypothetical protein EDD37DRAFT_636641 [Exophiala viscosa]